MWRTALFIAVFLLGACGEGNWNNPYPDADRLANTLYRSFDRRPKHLDPAQSYSSNEYELIANIYMPPLQYHYLKRPYTLEPLAAESMPSVNYFDTEGKILPATASPEAIAFSEYTIKIRPGMRYQPHPAFAQDEKGGYLYHDLGPEQLEDVFELSDLPETGTRELIADDYIYQVKRLAHPKLHSPIFGIMASYIDGMKEYAVTLKEAYTKASTGVANEHDLFFDLRQYDLPGVIKVDRYTYKLRIKGKYPQMLYWLALPFFSPIPVEAEQFYAQAGLVDRNITLDWYPVGSGPYMLTVNNPNLQMVMERNPNYMDDRYPAEGDPGDVEAGMLADAGKPMPFIDKAIYSLEREGIPYWNKFLQGYYDSSGISSDSFDQAISITTQGDPTLTDDMAEKGINLLTTVTSSTYYTGFNMLDPVIGGYSNRARKLRRAIAIAVDYEEYISIFQNGRGIAGHGPLPPGIYGYEEGKDGINPYVYDWVNERPRRKPVAAAKRLMAEAGYKNGIDPKTGDRLTLNLDTAETGPEAKAKLDWWRKQFAKIGIELNIRSTDYNRFQDKMDRGDAQIFQWGWNADYPDPENFMFLLYGPNGKVSRKGENAANYNHPQFNKLFDKMKNMDNGPLRQVVINKMVEIARRDSPWLWGVHPKAFGLHHGWVKNSKPNLMANNTLKYKRLDAEERATKRAAWNKPVTWPLYLLAVIVVVGVLPGIVSYRRKEHGRGGRH